ncbi:hypothetical protein B0A49_04916, partial [Cryomyces minteri]
FTQYQRYQEQQQSRLDAPTAPNPSTTSYIDDYTLDHQHHDDHDRSRPGSRDSQHSHNSFHSGTTTNGNGVGSSYSVASGQHYLGLGHPGSKPHPPPHTPQSLWDDSPTEKEDDLW